MSKFKVGDRVRAIKYHNGKKPTCLGTILKISPFNRIGVQFDETIGGHRLQGACRDGYGWNFSPDCLELVDEVKPHLVIAKTDTGYSPNENPKPHLVIAKTDTGYSPNENPKVHQGFDAAAAEAQRLAKTIGGEFVVFAPVAKAVAPKVEVEFTKL